MSVIPTLSSYSEKYFGMPASEKDVIAGVPLNFPHIIKKLSHLQTSGLQLSLVKANLTIFVYSYIMVK